MKREHWKTYRSLVVSAILSVGVAIAIFSFSSQTSEASDGISTRLAQWLLGLFSLDASEEALSLCDVVLRKMAHFSLYALFGMGLCGVFRWQHRVPPVLAAVVICAIYAISDEIHQLFIDGRTGRLLDIFIDTCGALTGALLASLLRRRWEAYKRRRRNKEL